VATKTHFGNICLAFESAAVDKGGDFTRIFVSGKGLANGVVATNGSFTASIFPTSTVEFSGTQNVTLTLATNASTTSFCIYGENQSNLGTFWVHSKATGGLQFGSYDTTGLAIGAC